MGTDDEGSLVSTGGWCAPSETIYDLYDRDAKPIVPDALMRDRVEQVRDHDCLLPEPEAYYEAAQSGGWADPDDFCCPTCGQWWWVTKDYCGECGRPDPARWAKGSWPLFGPEMEDGSWQKIPSAPAPLWEALGEISVFRGGLQFKIDYDTEEHR